MISEEAQLLWDTIRENQSNCKGQRTISSQQYKCLLIGIKKRYLYSYSGAMSKYLPNALFGEEVSYDNLPGWRAHKVVGWFIEGDTHKLFLMDQIAKTLTAQLRDDGVDLIELERGIGYSGGPEDQYDYDALAIDYDIQQW